MIVLTLAGNSERFFNEGYSIVKYKLPYGEKSVLENILDYIPKVEKLLIILNKKFNDSCFVENLCEKKMFVDYKIVEIVNTRGQLESVIFGLRQAQGFWLNTETITIYNGDTIRKLKHWFYPEHYNTIEVFVTGGDHWSFVDNLGCVNLIKEKSRISQFCSTGLYCFSAIEVILDYYEEYVSKFDGELYVAPFYNLLIDKGILVRSTLVDVENFIFCGTPSEYKQSLRELNFQ